MSARAAKRARQERRAEVVAAYAALAAHTAPICESGIGCDRSRGPERCCADLFCEAAERHAREEWGVRLRPATTVPRRPRFLGPDGCTVAPHLRPGCTGYACPGRRLLGGPVAQALGLPLLKPGEAVSVEWDTEYLRLHERAARACRRAGVEP